VKTGAENAVWYLRHHRLFDGATDDVVRGSHHLFVQRTYAAKAVLFEQGDIGRVVYLVKRGKVRLSRILSEGKEHMLAILGPGDIFGEEVMFTKNVVRTTQATVIEDAYLCLARMQDLFSILSRHPVVAMNIAKYLQEQRDEAIATAEEMISLKVPERIVRLFERLAAEHGVREASGIRIPVRLKHAEIASLVGSTRETVSVELGRLLRTERIILADGYYVLPELAQEALAVH
jgi:CRP/FNR family cyclic AMP-dependent transcriptional regulator